MPFRNIDDPVKLRRLLQSVLLLEADLQLPVLLRHFIEEACSMTAARYGALGVLNEERSELAEFITVGLDPVTERLIGARPTGRGVLGLLITDPRPLRLGQLTEHPERFGFPPHHPPMTSFLGVPVTARDEVYGNLYLTNKVGGSEFTQNDEDLASALAQAAGIAIENARLHAKVQEIAVFDERDRIARDLHDAVIQRLFAIGLSLQGISRSVTPSAVSERLEKAIADIDVTIHQIRATIFELSTPTDGIRASVLALVKELEPVVSFAVATTFEGPVDTAVTDQVAEHLLLALREALSNVDRHADATQVAVMIRAGDGRIDLTVSDNGHGMSDHQPTVGGLGLVNLRRRAEQIGGGLSVETSLQGTSVRWWAPSVS